jgi:hypothetical protein
MSKQAKNVNIGISFMIFFVIEKWEMMCIFACSWRGGGGTGMKMRTPYPEKDFAVISRLSLRQYLLGGLLTSVGRKFPHGHSHYR